MASLLPAERPLREIFPVRRTATTRWRDNDVFGHLNNAVYYEYFDSAVNRWLIESGALDPIEGPVAGLVAETACRFFAPVGFPQSLETGLRAERVGRRSVVYALALFSEETPAVATCRFVHVYVERATMRPIELPDSLRDALAAIG